MNKAKEIWRDKIRAERNEEFVKLDILYMRALESGNIELQQSIAAKKQALRDAPADKRIDDAQSSEQLKSLQIIQEILTN